METEKSRTKEHSHKTRLQSRSRKVKLILDKNCIRMYVFTHIYISGPQKSLLEIVSRKCKGRKRKLLNKPLKQCIYLTFGKRRRSGILVIIEFISQKYYMTFAPNNPYSRDTGFGIHMYVCTCLLP